MDTSGRDRAPTRHSWDRIAADTERIYDKAVPSRRMAARSGRFRERYCSTCFE
ncbi:hypothetical protein I546_5941 [Mycobacterium kansasii 732]|nr:hypothetical protein I546_5941 [Mycobacterium kansasii 732]